MEKRIGVIGLAVKPSVYNITMLRDVLYTHEAIIIGQMEILRAAQGVTVMALVIEGTTDDVGSMTGKLGMLPDVSVKVSLI